MIMHTFSSAARILSAGRALGLTYVLLAASFLASGCEPARRYPPRPHPPAKDDGDRRSKPSADLIWTEPGPVQEIPIVFVPESAKEWIKLPAYWNRFPQAAAGLPTAHLGQSPLGAVAAMVLATQLETIKIKVPRGLPDPTPFIPAGNRPTLGKWKLGQSLFFARLLPEKSSCASCHMPESGFTEDWAINRQPAVAGKWNTPSLINCVYNRHQFWDGRAVYLEETVTAPLHNPLLDGKNHGMDAHHQFEGLVQQLREDLIYQRRFAEVFGIPRPTQDAVAQALATYMRTILSGNSVYDRAGHERRRQGDAALSAGHFEAVLDTAVLKGLGQTNKTEAARLLAHGHELFGGKARCVLCHEKPLFTDHDFHNIGLGGSDILQMLSEEPGRLAHVPAGLKEARLKGALKTPTLRALPRTSPYMHDGSMKTLAEVVDYFDHGIVAKSNLYLAEPLRKGAGQARHLELDAAKDIPALILFLKALDGEPVDAVIRGN
jgi:cytochrome c peroxidase